MFLYNWAKFKASGSKEKTLTFAEAAASISTEQLKREQERWEISCREFEAEVNRMHSIEFARRQRRLASICIDKLLCESFEGAHV